MTRSAHAIGDEPSLRLRWILFGFLAASGVLALVDRQIISVLKPEMAHELGWTDDDYGTLGAWFQGATAVALLGAGPLVDRLGVKWANPIAVFSWSAAALFHGWAHSLVQFTLCRIGLGATEAAVTPTAVKTIATIFPPHMRSTGVGLQNAIASLGAISAPFIIPLIAAPFGWRGAFLAAGAIGLVWSVGWLLVTRKVNFGDAAPAAAADAALPRGAFFRDRAAWAVAGAKFLSDSTWWLLLFWMPDFLNRQFGLSGAAIAAPLALAYAGAAAGSLVSGTLATRFLAGGAPVNRVRKAFMLVSGLLVLPMPLALQAASPFAAAGILALVLAAHQGFSTSLFALITDVAPRAKIGRMTSFGVFSGNIGGMLILKVAGMVLAAGLGYLPLFLFASVSYLLALGWIHLMLPTIRLVDASERGEAPLGLH